MSNDMRQMCLVNGEFDRENRPACGPDLRPNTTVVCGHNTLANGEPEPCTPSPGSRFARLDKPVKDRLQLIFRDADALITDRQQNGSGLVLLMQAADNRTALG